MRSWSFFSPHGSVSYSVSFVGSHNHHLYTGDGYIHSSLLHSVLNYTSLCVCPCQFMPRTELLILSPPQPSTHRSVQSQSTSMSSLWFYPFLSCPHSTHPRPIGSISEHILHQIFFSPAPLLQLWSYTVLSHQLKLAWSPSYQLFVYSPQSDQNHSYSKRESDHILLFHPPVSSPCCWNKPLAPYHGGEAGPCVSLWAHHLSPHSLCSSHTDSTRRPSQGVDACCSFHRNILSPYLPSYHWDLNPNVSYLLRGTS